MMKNCKKLLAIFLMMLLLLQGTAALAEIVYTPGDLENLPEILIDLSVFGGMYNGQVSISALRAGDGTVWRSSGLAVAATGSAVSDIMPDISTRVFSYGEAADEESVLRGYAPRETFDDGSLWAASSGVLQGSLFDADEYENSMLLERILNLTRQLNDGGVNHIRLEDYLTRWFNNAGRAESANLLMGFGSGKSVQYIGDGNGGVVNTNPGAALLWPDGSASLLNPGKASFVYVDDTTGEETPVGELDVQENEEGELEGEFEPAPEPEIEIVEFFGGEVPAGYTHGESLCLKVANAVASDWDYTLRYAGGETITAGNVYSEFVDVNENFCGMISQTGLRINTNRALELAITANYEGGTAEIVLPVSGLDPIVQQDGSPLPDYLGADKEIVMKLLTPADSQTWHLFAYDQDGGDYIGYNLNQQSEFAWANLGRFTWKAGGSARAAASIKVQNSRATGFSHTIQIGEAPEVVFYTSDGATKEVEVLGVGAIEVDRDTGFYVGLQKNGKIISDVSVEVKVLKNDADVIMKAPQVYSNSCFNNGASYFITAEGVEPDFEMNPTTLKPYVTYTFWLEVSGANGEGRASGYIFAHMNEYVMLSQIDAYACEKCGVPSKTSHAAPCEKFLHFTCDGRTHKTCAACEKPLCSGDHTAYHSDEYGAGHAVCAGEKKHYCPCCQKEVTCTQIEAHASVVCGNIAHCNGNGMDHSPCGVCKKPLCSGTGHGEGVCGRITTATDPVYINLGDTVQLTPGAQRSDIFRGQTDEETVMQYGTVNVSAGSHLNLRSGPGEEYGIIGELSRGTRVYVASYLGDWAKVVTGEDVEGYVARAYLQLEAGQSYVDANG